MRAACPDKLAFPYFGTLIMGEFYKIQIYLMLLFLCFPLFPVSYILHRLMKSLLKYTTLKIFIPLRTCVIVTRQHLWHDCEPYGDQRQINFFITYLTMLLVFWMQWRKVQKNKYLYLHVHIAGVYIGCPTRYRNRQFFNNSNTNEDIAKKFEQEYVHCVRNETECVCYVCLQCA